MIRLTRASRIVAAGLAPLLLATACVVESGSNKKSASAATDSSARAAAVRATSVAPGPYEITANFAEEDTVVADTVTDTTAAWRSITPAAARPRLGTLPFTPPAAGPAALQLQILLDRSNFSPGVLDGRWGDNARRALQWFRIAHGMDSTDVVDQRTADALTAASRDPLFLHYTVTSADMAGPFVQIPSNVYARAKLQCLCYQSPTEELSERFHTTPAMLRHLNPRVDLAHLASGTALWVPNVARDTAAPAPYVTAKIVVSRRDFWTHALDSAGHVVAHYPSTLGSSYNPSPDGDFAIDSVYPHPKYYFDPTVLNDPSIPKGRPEATLPPGPNSPVGVVWMALTKEHLGIHGTENPATIGVTESHGCVRLTNWDAWTLSKSVHSGTPVSFP